MLPIFVRKHRRKMQKRRVRRLPVPKIPVRRKRIPKKHVRRIKTKKKEIQQEQGIFTEAPTADSFARGLQSLVKFFYVAFYNEGMTLLTAQKMAKMYNDEFDKEMERRKGLGAGQYLTSTGMFRKMTAVIAERITKKAVAMKVYSTEYAEAVEDGMQPNHPLIKSLSMQKLLSWLQTKNEKARFPGEEVKDAAARIYSSIKKRGTRDSRAIFQEMDPVGEVAEYTYEKEKIFEHCDNFINDMMKQITSDEQIKETKKKTKKIIKIVETEQLIKEAEEVKEIEGKIELSSNMANQVFNALDELMLIMKSITHNIDSAAEDTYKDLEFYIDEANTKLDKIIKSEFVKINNNERIFIDSAMKHLEFLKEKIRRSPLKATKKDINDFTKSFTKLLRHLK